MSVALLAQLDDAPVFAPNPAVWSANLAALRVQNPALAEQLAEIALPAHWRAVAALDGAPTFRLEAPGQPPVWLGGTAAPRTRAAAFLAEFQPGEHNPSLPTISAGAELALLLERLPRHKAVFVFEADLAALAAVLRLTDLSADLTRWRCILVPPEREAEFLKQCLTDWPGLLPPGNILCLPDATAERLARIRAVCEAVYQEILPARRSRPQPAPEASKTTPAEPDKPRLAILTLTPSRFAERVGETLARAARSLQWPVLHRVLNGPRQADLSAQSHALAEFAPALTLGPYPSRIRPPQSSSGPVCEWHWRACDVPEQLPDDGAWHLAASPRVGDALRAAGVPPQRLAVFYWGCDPTAEPIAAPTALDVKTVVLLGDWPNDEPAACGIEQPTHKKLWRQLRRTMEEAWDRGDVPPPPALFAAAERAAQTQVGEKSLRDRLAQFLEYVLIPAVIQERIKRTLGCEPLRTFTIGTGWSRQAADQLHPWADDLFQTVSEGDDSALSSSPLPRPPHFPIDASRAPLAAIVGGAGDPLSPAVLQAGLRGWPLLVYRPAGMSWDAVLGQILQPGRHFETFATARELRVALQTFRANPAAVLERARRTQTHLREKHSYAQRLIDLRQRLALPCS